MVSREPRREVLTWRDVDRLLDELLPQFRREFTAMVMITRGGIIPGGMLAEAMNLTHLLTAAVDFPAQAEQVKHVGPLVIEGALLAPNTPVVLVVGIDSVIVRTTITERDYGRVKKGQKVEVLVDAFPGRKFPGTVARDQSDVTFQLAYVVAQSR